MSYVETNTEIQNTVFKINIHRLYRVAKYLNNMQMTSGENRSLKVRGQGSGTKWRWLKLLSLIKNSSSCLRVFPWVETFQLVHMHMPSKLSLWWWLLSLWTKHTADAGTQQMFGTSGWTLPHRDSFLHCLGRIYERERELCCIWLMWCEEFYINSAQSHKQCIGGRCPEGTKHPRDR